MELRKLMSILDKDIKVTVYNSRGQICIGGFVSEYNNEKAYDQVIKVSLADEELKVYLA